MPSSQNIPNEDPETGEDLTEGRRKKRRKTKENLKKRKRVLHYVLGVKVLRKLSLMSTLPHMLMGMQYKYVKVR